MRRRDIVLGQIAGSNVDGDEINVGVLILYAGDRAAEQVARHNNNVCALFDSLIDGDAARVSGVLGGLIVGIVDAVGLAVGFDALPGRLVEGLVVDGADVGNKGDLGDNRLCGGFFRDRLLSGRFLGSGFFRSGRLSRSLCCGRFGLGGTGDHTKDHNQSKKKRKNLFHGLFLRIYFVCAHRAHGILSHTFGKNATFSERFPFF